VINAIKKINRSTALKNTKTPNYAAQKCIGNLYHSSKMYHSNKTVSYDSKNIKKSIQHDENVTVTA